MIVAKRQTTTTKGSSSSFAKVPIKPITGHDRTGAQDANNPAPPVSPVNNGYQSSATKSLPKIIRQSKPKEIDTSNQIFVELPKSALTPQTPILVTGKPGFTEQAGMQSAHSVPKTREKVRMANDWQAGPGDTPPRASQIQTGMPPIKEWSPSNLENDQVRHSVIPLTPAAPAASSSRAELKQQIEALLDKQRQKPTDTPTSLTNNSTIVTNPYTSKPVTSKPVIKRATPLGPELFRSNPDSTGSAPVMKSTLIAQSYAQTQVDEPVITGDYSGPTFFPRSPFAVLRGEALYIRRENGSVRLSDAVRVDPFDYDLGIRINAQRLFGVDGRSLTYTGLQEWNDVARPTSGGSLGIVATGSGLPAGTLTPFTGAHFQQHYHRANIHSLEWNNVTWGWDVLNVFWGLRFTRYEEQFQFFSARPDGQQGLLSMGFQNYIFGPQVGAEVLYDIGGIFSTGFKVKLGATANAMNRKTHLISNGIRRMNESDSDVDFNFVTELGIFSRMRLGRRAFLRGGYDVWYNSSVYGTRENIPSVITPTFGRNSANDDMFIHGATAGLEIWW